MQFRKCFFYAAALSIPLTSACSNSNSSLWSEDALSFCEAHELDNWKDIDKNMSITDFNEVAINQLKNNLKTDDFKRIADHIRNIEFYRDIYPDTQSKIEELTGEPWNCEAFEVFYSPSISRENDSSENAIISKTINIYFSGSEYLVNNSALDIEASDEMKKEIVGEHDPKSIQVIVTVDGEANIEEMGMLFDTLAGLGIQRLSIVER